MERANAYAALATELEQWRLKTTSELVSRVGAPPAAHDIDIAGELVTLEVSVSWADASRSALKIEAIANGPSHWNMGRLIERIIVPVGESPSASDRPRAAQPNPLLSMASIDYDRQLLGFVVRVPAISQAEWVAFASSHPAFRRQPPVMGTNPFTHQPMEIRNTNFTYAEGGRAVSLVAWEGSECIGVAGDRVASSSVISLLCDTFHATFEAVED